MATETLVDINAQIRDLEKADQGPLTAIKSGIQKYLDDLKALDQLTPAAQAQIDKLAGLQLDQARPRLPQVLAQTDLYGAMAREVVEAELVPDEGAGR